MSIWKGRREVDSEADVEKEIPIDTPSERVHAKKTKEVRA